MIINSFLIKKKQSIILLFCYHINKSQSKFKYKYTKYNIYDVMFQLIPLFSAKIE